MSIQTDTLVSIAVRLTEIYDKLCELDLSGGSGGLRDSIPFVEIFLGGGTDTHSFFFSETAIGVKLTLRDEPNISRLKKGYSGARDKRLWGEYALRYANGNGDLRALDDETVVYFFFKTGVRATAIDVYPTNIGTADFDVWELR